MQKYKSNFKECLTKITCISKLLIILLTNNYIFLFLLKMQNALQASATKSISKPVYTRIQGTLTLCKTGLHTDTGYSVQTPNLHLILKFFNKKGNCNFFMKFNYQLLSERRNKKPCFAELLLSRILFYTLY